MAGMGAKRNEQYWPKAEGPHSGAPGGKADVHYPRASEAKNSPKPLERPATPASTWGSVPGSRSAFMLGQQLLDASDSVLRVVGHF